MFVRFRCTDPQSTIYVNPAHVVYVSEDQHQDDFCHLFLTGHEFSKPVLGTISYVLKELNRGAK